MILIAGWLLVTAVRLQLQSGSSERWRDESVPSVRCVPVAGCSCVLHNTAARSNLHAEDSSLEVLNFVNDAVEGVNQKKK